MAPLSPFRIMSTAPVPPPPPASKKRRGCSGCLVWAGGGLLAVILGLGGVGYYGQHWRVETELQEGIAALRANDPETALKNLDSAAAARPRDAAVVQLYLDAQQKWIEALDRQLADKTPAQRYMILSQDPVRSMSLKLSEPLATAFRQYGEYNAQEAQVQINATVERAMNLVESGQFSDGWKTMESLREFHSFPGLMTVTWPVFNTFHAERLLVHAGDLGQNQQIEPARQLLEFMKKNTKADPGSQAAALFRIDLGDYLLHLNRAVAAAGKRDAPAAQAQLEEAKLLFARLRASPELANFYSSLPPADRGTPLIQQFMLAQEIVARESARSPAR